MGLWKDLFDSTIFVKDHAVTRMMERDIVKSDILEILKDGKEIEQYPNDFPYPSCLLFKVVEEDQFIWLQPTIKKTIKSL